MAERDTGVGAQRKDSPVEFLNALERLLGPASSWDDLNAAIASDSVYGLVDAVGARSMISRIWSDLAAQGYVCESLDEHDASVLAVAMRHPRYEVSSAFHHSIGGFATGALPVAMWMADLFVAEMAPKLVRLMGREAKFAVLTFVRAYCGFERLADLSRGQWSGFPGVLEIAEDVLGCYPRQA